MFILEDWQRIPKDWGRDEIFILGFISQWSPKVIGSAQFDDVYRTLIEVLDYSPREFREKLADILKVCAESNIRVMMISEWDDYVKAPHAS